MTQLSTVYTDFPINFSQRGYARHSKFNDWAGWGVAWDGSVTSTLPYTIDITTNILGLRYEEYVPADNTVVIGENRSSNDCSIMVTITAMGLFYPAGTTANDTQYSTKRWTTVVGFTSGTPSFVGAWNEISLQSHTALPVGTANSSGFARLVIAGNQILLNFYNSTSGAVDSAFSCYYWIDTFAVYGSSANKVYTGADWQTAPAPTASGLVPWPASPSPSPSPQPPPPGPPGKIVCTAMNEEYGFGSFRNKIWLKYAKDNLNKYHEIGYHAVFRPLIKIAYDPINKNRIWNSIVRKTIEELVRRRSIDLRAEMSGQKRDIRGRFYRFIWEPMCYIIGKLKEKKNGS